MHLTKFLPSYVGSKAYWVSRLEQYKGRDFVEFFAGSAVISASLANRTVLNDLDPFLHRYFREYESQPIVGTFTDRDYFAKRSQGDWYRHLYYLQKMSFSGLYRWSRRSTAAVPKGRRRSQRMSSSTRSWPQAASATGPPSESKAGDPNLTR